MIDYKWIIFGVLSSLHCLRVIHVSLWHILSVSARFATQFHVAELLKAVTD
jgi:hypothetical protein